MLHPLKIIRLKYICVMIFFKNFIEVNMQNVMLLHNLLKEKNKSLNELQQT